MSDLALSGLDIRTPSLAHHPQWRKCFLVAVALHLAILSIPISKLGGYYGRDSREIEVSVIPEPTPVATVPPVKPISRPVQPLKIEKIKNPPPSRPEGKKTAEEPQKIVSPDLVPSREMVQVGPGSGGVAIVGGTGTGATLSGSAGEPGGSGSGLGRRGVGGGGGGTGPVESQFGTGDGPQWAYQEKPVYPYAAQRLGKKGRVVLKLTIDEKGNLTKTEVMEATDQIFVSAVLDAARRSKFRPARRNGVPFAAWATWPVTFSLGDHS
ncbi:MAG: TonB family protein [Proteobacteria bacterium]|nr:TonB family protein [Pseudomonadota bacterium]